MSRPNFFPCETCPNKGCDAVGDEVIMESVRLAHASREQIPVAMQNAMAHLYEATKDTVEPAGRAGALQCVGKIVFGGSIRYYDAESETYVDRLNPSSEL